ALARHQYLAHPRRFLRGLDLVDIGRNALTKHVRIAEGSGIDGDDEVALLACRAKILLAEVRPDLRRLLAAGQGAFGIDRVTRSPANGGADQGAGQESDAEREPIALVASDRAEGAGDGSHRIDRGDAVRSNR